MKKISLILTTLAASATLSLAQDAASSPSPAAAEHGKGGARGTPEEMFKKLDTDNSGSISLDEMKASPMGKRNPDKVEEHFKKLDTDNNGSISLDEFKAGRAARGGGPSGSPGAAHKGGGKKGGAPSNQ